MAVSSAWRGAKLDGNMWQWLSIIIISAGDYRANPGGVGTCEDYLPRARSVRIWAWGYQQENPLGIVLGEILNMDGLIGDSCCWGP